MAVLAQTSEVISANLALIFCSVFLGYILKNYFHNGLHKYPGPFFAQFTDIWRLIDVFNLRAEATHISLHEKHGDIVRLGPNSLSFANPKAVNDIYGLNKGFIKSDFYPVQQAMAKGQRLPSLFSTTDETYHAQLRRGVNSAFSMSALVQYEPIVQPVVEHFLIRTEELYTHDGAPVCDFMTWLQYYAFDAIGKITYSKPHGFIERNEDVDGIVTWLRSLFDYAGWVGQWPFLDLLMKKNPIWPYLEYFGLTNSTSPVVTFARARMGERLAEMAKEEEGSQTKLDAVKERPDLLAKFLKAKADRPEFFHDGRVLVMAVSMALAGSETTAISLSAIFYYLLKNPDTYDKLMRELDDAVASGRIRDTERRLFTFAEAQSLTYFDAVVKETFRMHPAVGLILERIVPPQGAEICGEKIPGGVIVGCSPWPIHRRKEIFGQDADRFRPERWLEASPTARREMEATLFHFGAGSRTCLGKNISLLEIYNLVPAFLLRFKVSLADPSKEWELHNAWFVRQKNFFAHFELRRQ